jgi:hypothetical protein
MTTLKPGDAFLQTQPGCRTVVFHHAQVEPSWRPFFRHAAAWLAAGGNAEGFENLVRAPAAGRAAVGDHPLSRKKPPLHANHVWTLK